MALSVDIETRAFLTGERAAGLTLAVYDRAVYLKMDGGPIVVIGRADIGNGPGSILIDYDGSLKNGRPAFCPDERFETGGGLVKVGGDRIIVDLLRADGWDPAIAAGGIHRPAGLGACMEVVKGMVQSRGGGGLVHVLGDLGKCDGLSPQERYAEASAAPVVCEKVRSLADALAKDCEAAGRLAVRRLIGLGEGLTPSCDDLLVGLAGFMYGASNDPLLGAYAKRTTAWLGEELASAEGRTTPVAAHFLSAAGRGRFSERVKDLLEAVFAADEKRMERASERLIEYGATSGIDLMCGMVLGYEVVKNMKQISIKD